MSRKSYKVGYGRPPEKSQWKPGHSGNPSGRPKKKQNVKTISDYIVEELSSLIKTTVNGKSKSMAFGQAFAKKLLIDLMNASPKDKVLLLNLFSKMNIFQNQNLYLDDTSAQEEGSCWTDSEIEFIKNLQAELAQQDEAPPEQGNNGDSRQGDT